MPTLDIRDVVTVLTGILTLSGMIAALKGSVTKLHIGQTEVLRQLTALHKRMDSYGERLMKTERNHAVLEERVDNIRQRQLGMSDTQRLRIARPDEVPVFRDGE